MCTYNRDKQHSILAPGRIQGDGYRKGYFISVRRQGFAASGVYLGTLDVDCADLGYQG